MENEHPIPQQKPDWPQFIFFNEHEVRPGWRLGIALLLLAAISACLGFLFSILSRHLPHGFLPSTMMVGESFPLAGLIFVTWIMSRIERRPMGEYGLPLPNAKLLLRFVRGYVFWGFLPLSLLLLTLRALHAFYFGEPSLHGPQILYWAGMWAVVFLLVGLYEEYSFRGYLLYTLADGIGFWPAAVVLAVLFGLVHASNPGESRIGILMAASFGFFASVVLRYTGNLWLAVGAHAGWDWGQSYFYGVSDSGIQARGHLLNPHIQGPPWLNGGTVGPEGSILCLVLMAIMAVLIVLLYRRSKPATETLRHEERLNQERE